MKNGFAARALLVAVIALLLVACGKPKGPGGEIWKEEVRLMNGDLIIVDRRNVWGQSGDLSQGHGPLTKAELHFDYRGKRYDWGQRGLGPVALQEDPEGRMYVVSIIPYCWAWSEWGKPNSYYLVHRFEDGKWKRLDVTEVDQATVFNLASKSSDPDSMESRDYVPETAWKYKDDTYAPNRKIQPGYRPRACR